jgi:hypothetical protein
MLISLPAKFWFVFRSAAFHAASAVPYADLAQACAEIRRMLQRKDASPVDLR